MVEQARVTRYLLRYVQVFDWSLGKVRLSDIHREGQGLLEEVNHHAAAVRHAT